MTIREAIEKLDTVRKELGAGHVFQTSGRHETRLEFVITLPNDSSMQGISLPEPPQEKASDG